MFTGIATSTEAKRRLMGDVEEWEPFILPPILLDWVLGSGLLLEFDEDWANLKELRLGGGRSPFEALFDRPVPGDNKIS